MGSQDLIEGIRKGELYSLSRAITYIESSSEKKRRLGEEVVETLIPDIGGSVRLAISGSPGTGKSTFIEYLGWMLCEQGKKVAVLAIDPSSTLTKGSILGDKTRMEKLAKHPLAYIRPSPNSSMLGGVSPATRESIFLCEAAGFDVVMVETVGVGQSEIAAKDMTDIFLLLAQPGSGDELQGIKKGIVEIADFIAVTKCDGIYEKSARASLRELKAALTVSKMDKENLTAVSSVTGNGIKELWKSIGQEWAERKNNGELDKLRGEQEKQWLKEIMSSRTEKKLFDFITANGHLSEEKGGIYSRSDKLIKQFFQQEHEDTISDK